MLKWFVNLKMSKKLLICFLLMALLAAIISAVGIRDITVLKNKSTELYESNVLGVQYAEEASQYFERLRYNIAMLAVQDAAGDIFGYRQRVDEHFQNVVTMLGEYEQLIRTDEQRRLYNKVLEYWNEFLPVRDEIFNNVIGKYTKEKVAVIDSYSEISDLLHDAFTDLVNFEIQNAKDKADQNNATAIRAIIVEVAITVVVIILAILLGSYVTYVTNRPIVRIVKVAEKLALGDIDVKPLITERALKRRDEIGELTVALNKLVDATAQQVEATERLAKGDLTKDMHVRSDKDILGKSLQTLIDSLNQIASSIIRAAGQVAAGADSISSSSAMLSDGATRQASAIEELTASIEQIAAKTAHNAENARKANQVAAETKQTALKGNTQMDAMLQAMDAISKSSANISKIIKVIDDIAFQTNILALNAAVEAARAGQHGKGFAVVADEVRTLAARSANAAKETTEMIEESIRNIKSGITIAQDTAAALNEIVEEISNVAALVEAIAAACNEQALGIENINQGIAQVSQVVQSNAASAEESAAASEELASQAQQLKEIVSVFETKQSVSDMLFDNADAPAQIPAGKKVMLSLEEDDSPDKY